jgi:hypothetical protein
MWNRGPAPDRTVRRDSAIGLVLGVVGLWLLGVVLGAVALLLGLRSRRAGGGLVAVAAIALGALDIVLWVLGGATWDASPGYASMGM